MERCDWVKGMYSRMDNGKGENEFMEMMGLKEKMFPGEKMCPWGWIVVMEERWAKEMWFGETTFPKEKVGLGRSFSLRIDNGRGGDGVRERL